MSTSLRLSLVLLFVLLLTACGGSDEEPTPTEVNVLTIHYWQAPSVPSPYLSGGNKDTDAAAVTLEPLAKYDPEGNIVPALAAEIPTIENGGVSRDLMSITWKLKEGLKWSDGTDVTAEDVAFHLALLRPRRDRMHERELVRRDSFRARPRRSHRPDQIRSANSLPVPGICRQWDSHHQFGTVRRLHRRGRLDLPSAKLRPARDRPLPHHQLPTERPHRLRT